MKLLTLKEATEYSGIPRSHLFAALTKGAIKTEIRFRRRSGSASVPQHYIPLAELEEFIETYRANDGKVTPGEVQPRKTQQHTRSRQSIKDTKRRIEEKLVELAAKRDAEMGY